jgi:hypothetical protein
MTTNDDGIERLRRDWIADAVRAHAMRTDGHVIDTRRFVPTRSGCLAMAATSSHAGRCPSNVPPSRRVVDEKQKRKFSKSEKARDEQGLENRSSRRQWRPHPTAAGVSDPRFASQGWSTRSGAREFRAGASIRLI